MTRVVLADDHASIRAMMQLVFTGQFDFEFVGETGSGLEAIRLCEEKSPDMLILDMVLPDLSGPEVLARVRRRCPSIKVLVYSGAINPDQLALCLRNRPHGFVEKTNSLDVFREAVRAVASGGCYFTPLASKHLFSSSAHKSKSEPHLTEREREILQMIAESHTTKEIARKLHVSIKTVERHRTNLMDKLKVRDIAALTRYAMRKALIGLE